MKELSSILLDVPELDSTPECFELALKLSETYASTLTLMTVLPSFKDLFSIFETDEMREDLQDDLEKQAMSGLNCLSEIAQKQGVAFQEVVEKGSKIRRLVAQVRKDGSDLVMKDVGKGETTFSANDLKIARYCPCPVWFRTKKAPKKSKGIIVVAIDGEVEDKFHLELNKRLVSHGKLLAAFFDTELHVLHAWKFDKGNMVRGAVNEAKYLELRSNARKHVEERFEKCIEKLNINSQKVAVHISEGTPSKVVSKFCADHTVETLVMGTVGRAGLSGILIGNTAERVMSLIECSLLIVSPEEVQASIDVGTYEESVAYASGLN